MIRATIFALAATLAASALAQEPAVPDAARKKFDAIRAHAPVQKALDLARQDDARTFAEQKELVVIASPPFKEEARAKEYLKRFVALGYKDARIDKEGNVIAMRRGNGKGPTLVLSAHLDTVFPPETDLTIKEKDGKTFVPGIGDDTRGLAEVLSIARSLDGAGVKTVGDIWLVGTVGEEGLGDLRGVKALFRDNGNIDGFISIDGSTPQRITYLAVGSHRYRFTFEGPGGHSYAHFGRPSAIHAMGRAIAKIGDIQAPRDPKTTFTVGTVTGGISVNAIAATASMEVDMRSLENAPMLEVERQVLKAVNDAVAEENARWGRNEMTVDIKLVGDRPAGRQAKDVPIIHASILGLTALGFKPVLEDASSTDSNIPISLGIPAVTLGRGGITENQHSPAEAFINKDAYLGVQKTLLTVLALVGVEGAAEPMLAKR